MIERRVNVNQIKMQIREYEHEGDAVIFLHFGGANLEMWQRAVPYFQERISSSSGKGTAPWCGTPRSMPSRRERVWRELA
ncbi:MAG: hypothetical protein JXA89_09070 [Anaerolineae bacterium]|nr:hypothetical protein [Anaerolineae bacterium]